MKARKCERAMRVLHVLDHSLPVHSGYSIRSQNIILQQRRMGWSTFHLTGPRHGSVRDEIEQVGELEFIRTSATIPSWASGSSLEPLWTAHAIRNRLRSLITQIDPDLIHAHSPCINGLAAMNMGRPFVYEMRTLWEEGSVLAGKFSSGGVLYLAARGLESFVMRHAGAVVTISDGLHGDVIDRGISPDRITVVPNAVDIETLRGDFVTDSAAARSTFGLQDCHVLGYIGSLFAWEGLDLLIAALAKTLPIAPNLKLLIIGTGPEEQKLRESANTHGVQDRVIFAGQLAHESAVKAYAAVDTLVYPRSPMKLTDLVTPLKPLEAMALGRVCIASDVGGHRELIEDGVTGLLFRAGDVDALSAAILRAVRDPQLRQSIIANGPERVRRDRTWAQTVPRYVQAYSRALNRSVPVPAM
jgi:glycogen(starch) synthase